MSHRSAVIDTVFWENRLEVGTDLVCDQHADDRYMQAWADGLSPTCRSILAQRLGIASSLSIAEFRRAVLAHRDELLRYLLLDAAAQNTRMHAVVEVARSQLPATELDHARISGDSQDEGDAHFDRNALTWLLFERDPSNLERVLLIDRAERHGSARMVLEGHPSHDHGRADVFFERENIQRILDAYEREHRTLRQSHCFAILRDRGTYKVFIKRDFRPSFVSRGATNTFGFEREWIVLDFDSDLRRVRIGSCSPDAPLQLANRITCTYFGQSVSYANERIASAQDKIAKFLRSLCNTPSRLPLVELVIRNSDLAGAPQLRFNALGNESLAPALSQFSAAFGYPLQRLTDIESIKLLVFKRRVRLIFEPVPSDSMQYVVRYTDQSLDDQRRREFERMMVQDYGIAVLPSEKKYAR